jgi:hypothetical protein
VVGADLILRQAPIHTYALAVWCLWPQHCSCEILLDWIAPAVVAILHDGMPCIILNETLLLK